MPRVGKNKIRAIGLLLVLVAGIFIIESPFSHEAKALGITFVNSTTGGASLTTGQADVISVPTGVVPGDLLIAEMTATSLQTFTTPAGWTLEHHNTAFNTMDLFYRVATGTESSTYSFVVSGTANSAFGMMALRGEDTATPFLGVSTDTPNVTASSLTVPAVSWAGAANVVSLIDMHASATSPMTITWPSGWDPANGITSFLSPSNDYVAPNLVTKSSVTSLTTQTIGLNQSTNYSSNQFAIKVADQTVPDAPTLNIPADGSAGIATTPQFQMSATDADNDYLRYKIDVCSVSNCSSIVRTIDQTSSQTGWSGQDQQTGTAYTGSAILASSTMAVYTYQAPALSAGTQYWWRAYAIDPGGSNTFSSASTIQTFTTNNASATPTLVFPAASATGISALPIFYLRTTDAESDYLQYFIQIYDATACGGSQVGSNIDQTSSQTHWQGQDAGSGTAYLGSSSIGGSSLARYQYSSTALTPGHLYSWRAKAIDPGGSNTFGSLSTCQDFTVGSSEAVINGGTTINGGTIIQ